MHIAIDYDNTIVQSTYPDVGELLPDVKKVINYWYDRGHTIIINTCRAKYHADNAKNFLVNKGVRFSLFNENDKRLIEKYGTDTRKISADVYIEDKDINQLVLKHRMGEENYNYQFWSVCLQQLCFLEKPTIICIVGESGAGKSLAANYLWNDYDINLIDSYTDRPKRKPDETGHIFLKPKEFDRLQGDRLAYTKYGEHRYCSLVSDMFHINTYVIDENGLQMLKSKWSEAFDVISLRIKRPLFDRIENVGEERTDRDKGKFNMKDCEFDYVIDNDDNQKEFLFHKVDEFMRKYNLKERAKEYDLNI